MDSVQTANHGLRNATIRAVAAILLGVIFLAITSFSFLTLLRGPTPTDDIQLNEQGSFVSRDVYAILGFYSDDAVSSENVTGRYSVVPMGGKLVTVQFSNRYLENSEAVCASTYDFVNGEIQFLDSYVTVQGTVSTLNEKQKGILYDWFDLNKAQLVEMQMVADVTDYSTVLSDQVLVVDTVNGHSQILVYVLSSLAALCLLWAVIELILMATGRYLKKTDDKECDCGTDDECDGGTCCCDDCVAEAEAVEAVADEAPEAVADEAPEAVADEAAEAVADEAPEASTDEAAEAETKKSVDD